MISFALETRIVGCSSTTPCSSAPASSSASRSTTTSTSSSCTRCRRTCSIIAGCAGPSSEITCRRLAGVPYDKDQLPVTVHSTARLAALVASRVKEYVNGHVAPVFPEYAPLHSDYEAWLRDALACMGGRPPCWVSRLLSRGFFRPEGVRSLWRRVQAGRRQNLARQDRAPHEPRAEDLRRFIDPPPQGACRLPHRADQTASPPSRSIRIVDDTLGLLRLCRRRPGGPGYSLRRVRWAPGLTEQELAALVPHHDLRSGPSRVSPWVERRPACVLT